ncbi:DeoR family transcriptional regulator [Streptomyces hydrogenans]|uniref:DeoR family transcriptional regulator n=1 Tax=Streptomyces hydrogenans TaxID=1873719 RepID=UPI0035DA6878
MPAYGDVRSGPRPREDRSGVPQHERRNALLELPASSGRPEVEEAATPLAVSAATIRRDLDELAEHWPSVAYWSHLIPIHALVGPACTRVIRVFTKPLPHGRIPLGAAPPSCLPTCPRGTP